MEVPGPPGWGEAVILTMVFLILPKPYLRCSMLSLIV